MPDYRCFVRDRDGNVVQRSRNLAGIRSYVSNHIIKVLSITEIDDYGGRLCVLFDNGCSYETEFASFDVLRGWVANWRNVYGAPLIVNGVKSGTVSHDNPALRRQ